MSLARILRLGLGLSFVELFLERTQNVGVELTRMRPMIYVVTASEFLITAYTKQRVAVGLNRAPEITRRGEVVTIAHS